MPAKALMTKPGEGALLRVVGDTIRVLASGADTGGAYEVFDLSGPRESGPPPHAHRWNESYVIIEGEVLITMGDDATVVAPGTFVNIPAGTMHAYKIVSEKARFIVMTNPAGASELFTDLDRETGGSIKQMDKILQVARRHGLTMAAPAGVR